MIADDVVIDDGPEMSGATAGGCPAEGAAQAGNMVCMSPYVFAFCVVLSALASATVVASQRIHTFMQDKLQRFLEPYRIHNPRLRRHSASRQLDQSSERPLIFQAAEAMDRAASAPLELEHKVPARYVRAFCGNEKHALVRWKATLKWRKENEIDTILNEPQPFFHDIRRYFPSHMSGRSRGGHIVVYEKLGKVDMRKLRREKGVTVPMLLRHWIFVSEYQYRVLQPTDAAQQMTIVDMKGVRMQDLAGKIQEYIKAVAQLARLYYVERCHKTFVVNAPAWFGLAFRLVSPFLSARTRQKIRLLGSDLAALQEEIDPQFLPVEYGGGMTVPVSESSDERNLRRLVDALNANADAPKTGDNGGAKSISRSSSGSRSNPLPGLGRHPSERSPPKNKNRKSATVHQRMTPPRKGQQQQQQQQQQKQFSPNSGGRSRARTNDPAPGSARRGFSPAPDQTLGARRATWAGGGDRGDLRRRPAEGQEDHARGSRRSEHAGARVGGEREVTVGRGQAGGGEDTGGRGWREGGRGKEESMPLGDRLQAVMKDLGVPSGELDSPARWANGQRVARAGALADGRESADVWGDGVSAVGVGSPNTREGGRSVK